MKQEVKDKAWLDETGQKVPLEYISKGTRLKERYAHRLLKKAKQLNEKLSEYKTEMQNTCEEILQVMREEHKVKGDHKGNYTWYNFDASIKIEVSINERIAFDDIAIAACKEKLNEFLDNNLESKQEYIKQIVNDAFSTTRGKLDSKKVMSLIKYRSKIKNPTFQEALNLLESSIRRPDSRTYYRISERLSDGSYEVIDLNFSSI